VHLESTWQSVDCSESKPTRIQYHHLFAPKIIWSGWTVMHIHIFWPAELSHQSQIKLWVWPYVCSLDLWNIINTCNEMHLKSKKCRVQIPIRSIDVIFGCINYLFMIFRQCHVTVSLTGLFLLVTFLFLDPSQKLVDNYGTGWIAKACHHIPWSQLVEHEKGYWFFVLFQSWWLPQWRIVTWAWTLNSKWLHQQPFN